MASVGGPVKSFTVAGREFRVVGDADVNIMLGGMSSELSPNGDGTARPILTPMPWKAEGISANIDHDRGDLEFLQEKCESPDGEFPITITLVNDVTFGGSGRPTGELNYSSQSGACPVTLSGAGKLEQQ